MCALPTPADLAKVKADKAATAKAKMGAKGGKQKKAAVPTVYVLPTRAMGKWNMPENKAWLASRGLPTAGIAAELKARVNDHKDDPILVAYTSQTLKPVVHDVTMLPSIDDSTTVAATASVVIYPTTMVDTQGLEERKM